jgi:predicted nucleic acid-binding protein
MRTAIDTSVLLDLLTDDPAHAAASEAALRRAGREGALLVCECVLVEIAPSFAREDEVDEFVADMELQFVPSTRESATLAGSMFRAYLSRRPASGPRRVAADFIIGAHARVHADRLLARDRGYYRDSFKGLTLLTP